MTGGGWVLAALRHDRWLVIGGLVLIQLAAVAYTVAGIGMDMSAIDMTRMARPPGQPMEMGPGPVWTLPYAMLVFLMWWIMMIAMMVPSAAPTILLHHGLTRSPDGSGNTRDTWAFIAGYLAVWAGFSLLAAGLQWALQPLGLIAPGMMSLRGGALAGSVLILAGLYQFTPLKHACLRPCQAPAAFLSHHWQPGPRGAWKMGLRHGALCLGCCWALMGLLFVGGVMNLYWIAGLALLVAVEKLAPFGRATAAVTGAALILSGVAVFVIG
jgi:predicted metal-binding membrane protein